MAHYELHVYQVVFEFYGHDWFLFLSFFKHTLCAVSTHVQVKRQSSCENVTLFHTDLVK